MFGGIGSSRYIRTEFGKVKKDVIGCGLSLTGRWTYILIDRGSLIAELSDGSCGERKFDLKKYGKDIQR